MAKTRSEQITDECLTIGKKVRICMECGSVNTRMDDRFLFCSQCGKKFQFMK